MGKKDGMYLYNDWLAPFEKLEKCEVGELVISMMKYYASGEKPPKFDGLLGMAADFIFPQIDRSMEYAKLGQKGGIASKGQKRKEETSPAVVEEKKEEIKAEKAPAAPEREESDSTENTEKEKGSDDLCVPYLFEPEEFSEDEVPESEEKGDRVSINESRVYEEMLFENSFYKFWREYPKKIRKEKAFAAFKKLSPDSALLSRMLSVLNEQKGSDAWKSECGRFVPLPENWLEDRRWEDTVEVVENERKQSSFDTDEFFKAALKRGEMAISD